MLTPKKRLFLDFSDQVYVVNFNNISLIFKDTLKFGYAIKT